MNRSKFILDTTPNAKLLETVDFVNRSFDASQGVSKTRLLLITLSTTVMMALKSPLPKEYYQWTRGYLETIRNEDGTSLPNITKFLKYMDAFEKQHNIEDELQNTRVELPQHENIEIIVEDTDEDLSPFPNATILSSTKVPQTNQNINEEVEVENVEVDAALEQEADE